ncbi:MAG: N-acyl homoserine lactonase family protein [Pseudomonadales bacterium]
MLKVLTLGCLLSMAITTYADVRLTVFNCGELRFPDITAFGLANDATDVREMFVPCYLVEHPKGRLLWDTGLPLGAAGQGNVALDDGSMRYARSIVAQLADRGLTPSDIDLLALSHFHFDHAGGANAFADATLLIQQTEYDAAFLHAQTSPVFDRTLYAALETSRKRLLNGDHDVFGDGTVRIVSAPGHTPGHQVLLLALAKTGPLMLSGDLYHFRASRTLRAVPVFNSSKEQSLASMAHVESLLAATRATFWIEHDMALARTLKLSPAFYD